MGSTVVWFSLWDIKVKLQLWYKLRMLCWCLHFGTDNQIKTTRAFLKLLKFTVWTLGSCFYRWGNLALEKLTTICAIFKAWEVEFPLKSNDIRKNKRAMYEVIHTSCKSHLAKNLCNPRAKFTRVWFRKEEKGHCVFS